MSLKLENKFLCLDILEPGEKYRGSRFDWTGQIIQIIYKNKYTFCTTESLNNKFLNEKGRGLFNEFGIDHPLGYNECRLGDNFPKIGVGLLKRKSFEPYNFGENYSVSPYSFSYKVKENEVEFICRTNSNDDYIFQLNKKIKLKKDYFFIEYELFNLGNKSIITNEYVHNFLSINYHLVDKCYKLILPFGIEPANFEESVNPKNVVEFFGNSITWNSIPTNQFFFGKLNTDYFGRGMWSLVNLDDKIGISESVDFNIQKMNLWGTSHVICPEIFLGINILPKKNLRWVRKYTVFSI